MKKSKNNNIILGFGYWVFEFGVSWCKGKVKNRGKVVKSWGLLENKACQKLKSSNNGFYKKCLAKLKFINEKKDQKITSIFDGQT